MAFSIAFYTSLKNKIQGDAGKQCKVVFDFIKITYLQISYLLLYTYCWAINNHQIVYGFSCLTHDDKELTAVTVQQRKLTPLWYQILPLIHVGVHVCFALFLFFLYALEFDHYSLSHISFKNIIAYDIVSCMMNQTINYPIVSYST